MYKIIGGDGQEYGPVPLDTLRQWVREGRLYAKTQVLAEGAREWITLGSLAELGDIFNTPPPISAPAASASQVQPGLVYDGDYDLDIGGCVGRGFGTFTTNLGTLIAVLLLGMSPWLISVLLEILSFLPIVGVIFSILGVLASLLVLVIGGPMLGGVYMAFLKAQRNQSVDPVSDVFSGFRNRFGHLLLGYLIPVLFTCLCTFLPLLALVFALALTFGGLTHGSPAFALMVVGIAFLITLPAMIWLSLNWMFTLPLIIDKRLDFWTAMKTSWRQVSRHWWTVFGLMVLVGLINLAGLLVGVVGLLFTAPIGICASMQAYETLFTPRASDSGQGA
jgi:uncharacterized membrane protein